MRICWRIKRDKKTAADLKPASIIEMFISGITTKILVTDQDLADIITIAFYGGLNWCERAYPKDGHWMGNPGNHILNGGVIILCDIDGEERYELNKLKLLRGITGLIEKDNWDLSQYGSEEPLYDGNLKNLPFSKFREWHDLKIGKITPLKLAESAFLVIEIKGAKK